MREAKRISSEYLTDTYKGSVIKDIEPITTVADAEYALTEYAEGRFVWQKQSYDFVVNTRTGEIYTSVHVNEIKERLEDVLAERLGIASRQTSALDISIYYLDTCDKTGFRKDFRNVLPEGETAEELFEKISEDPEAYTFSVTLEYKGDEIPQEIMEGGAPFPSMSRVGIYHIAEEYGLYEGEHWYMDLPILSEEILWRGYSGDTYEYTGNQVMEREGFRVVYNAYEKIKDEEAVTEMWVGEEDIMLSITDEYIMLDCTKEHFSMYLFATDKESAERYRYCYDILNEGSLRKGVWYPYEEYYVYAGYLADVPYEFNSGNREMNTIFTSELSGN